MKCVTQIFLCAHLQGQDQALLGEGTIGWFFLVVEGSSYTSTMIHTIMYMEIRNVVTVRCGALSVSILVYSRFF